MGEIHIALLRLIIKDIEDVARTPSGGLGTNQYTAANPEGGHPRIVEGVISVLDSFGIVPVSIGHRQNIGLLLHKLILLFTFFIRHIFGVLTYATGKTT